MTGRRLFETAILVRAAVLWVLIRAALAGVLMVMESPPLGLATRASVGLVLVVGALSWLDTRRRNEDLLLANLGVSRGTVHGLGLAPPLAGEVLLHMAGFR
jgi:hypothetical protein